MPALHLRAQRLKGERHRTGQPAERLDMFSGAFPPRTVCELLGSEHGGKHLLWRLLTLLERPAEGEVFVGEQATCSLAENVVAQMRNQLYGYLFATPYLLPGFTVVENVAMPLLKLCQVEPGQANARTEEVLRATGLLDAAAADLSELSTLQHQLVALARAVIHHPGFLAMERFGENLTGAEAAFLSEVCQDVATQYGVSVIATLTPGMTLAWADRKLEVENGWVKEVARTPGRS